MKKERHPVDEFFREELEDYRVSPSEKARATFLEEAKEQTQRSTSRRWYLGLSLVILLLTAGAIYFFSLRSKPIPEADVLSASNNKIQPVQETQPSEKTESGETPLPLTKRESKNSPAHPQKQGHTRSASLSAPISEPGAIESAVPESAPVKGPEELSSPGLVEETAGPDSLSAISTDIDTVGVPSRNGTLPDSLTQDPPAGSKLSPKASVNSEWRLGAGVSFSPEWMFGTIEEPTFVTNFGIEGMFRFGRYSIRTGAGISLSKGFNQLQVEYNEYLGSYMKLDSMTFAWDEHHYYILPTYWLTNKEVYDSLLKLDNARVIKRYTYLQIPLIFGYDFFSRDRVSVGLRIGPILSILLKEKNLSDPYDPGMKKILTINEITPGQVNLNWQIMLGLNATFRLSKRLGVEVEPFAKYYFNSVYETSGGTGKPWSVGLRAAFFLSFRK